MKKKRLLSLFLALVMVLGLLPMTAWAENNDNITVNVTISDEGMLRVAHQEVTVTDQNTNGSFDVDDVLYAAHEKFYKDETGSGYCTYTGQYGLSIGTLWGNTSGAFGYYVNDASAGSLTDEVENGDKVVAFIYKDQVGWRDAYSYFDQSSATVETNETLDLVLSAFLSWSGASVINGATVTVTVDGDVVDDAEGNEVITDEAGKAAISFDKAGTYLISAIHEGVTLVPPVCIVTVTDDQTPGSETEDNNNDNENEAGNKTEEDEQEEESEKIKKLMETIAASYVNNSSDWVIMDMAAYEDLNPNGSRTSAAARQKYINTVITSLNGDNVGETDYSKAILALTSVGVDAEELYPENSTVPISAVAGLNAVSHGSSAWVAPYTLAAYNQKDYENIADYENAIISSVLASQQQDGSWSEWEDSVQTTSNMMVGLVFYYGENEAVTAALDKAVTYLSSVQKADGSFDAYGSGPDANTAAMVVIGLSALGINPDTDERFIKNDSSALDALLAFALKDNSGFGYTNNTAFNSYATEQAFRALIAAKQVMDTGKAFNIYDFSHNADSLQPGYANPENDDEENPVIPPVAADEISVTVSIDANGDDWMEDKSVTIEEGATVYDAFIKALKGSGITQEGASKGYIESMTYDGETLDEFDEGENSGWLYKVNGRLPEVGIKDYYLDDGDDILFYYTEDWKEDPDAGKRFEEEIPEEDAEAVKEVNDLIDKIGEVTLESVDAIKAAREAYDALTEEQKELVENYEALLEAEAALAALLAEQEEEELPAIEEIYTDISADSYYYEAAQWAVAKGIVSGVTETEFGADLNCSRGQLMTFLWRMMGSPEPETQTAPYIDVAKGMYYHDAILWATENNLANGTDGISFSPDTTLNRGQAVTFLWRAAGMPEPASETGFADVNEADYFHKAVLWAAENGITSGTGDNMFSPDAPCTRGQIVTFLYRCFGK